MEKPSTPTHFVAPLPRTGVFIQIIGWLGLFISGIALLAQWLAPASISAIFEGVSLLVQGILLMIAGSQIKKGHPRGFTVFLGSFLIFILIITYRFIYVFPELFSKTLPTQQVGIALGVYTFLFLAASFYIFGFSALWKARKS